MTERCTMDREDKNPTSPTLIAALREQSPAAWDRLVELYAPTVVQWCRQLKLSEQEMPDVLQEVFQVVATRLHQFRRTRKSDTFRGWLRTVTRNKVMDHFRAKLVTGAGGTEAQARLAELPEPNVSAEEAFPSDESETELLTRALALIQEHFEKHTWQAFWMTVVESRATADVAADLNMTAGAVRVAKSRVLSRLRQELGDSD